MSEPIVVVGSINLDLVAETKRIPIAGETVAGLSFRTFPGGKGANQAVAAARLGGAVRMIGKLGADAFGIELRKNLIVANVDTGGVGIVPTSSGVALIATDEEGQNAITVVAGANGHASWPVNRVIIEHNGERDLVYYWFRERNRRLTNEYVVRWYIFWDALTRNRTDGALVRLVAPIPKGVEAAQVDSQLSRFAASSAELLDRFVPD